MYVWGPIRMRGSRTSQAEEVYTPFVAGEEAGSLWFEISKGRRAITWAWKSQCLVTECLLGPQ